MNRYQQAKETINMYERIFNVAVELNTAKHTPQNRKKLLDMINYAKRNGFTYKTNAKNGVELWFENAPHERYPAVEIYVSNNEIQICDDTLHGTLLGLHEFVGEYEMEMRGM